MSAFSFRPVVVALLAAFSAAAFGAAACTARDAARETRTQAVDDYGAVIAPAAPAKRIVSLNPATTEILFAIGAGASVVGRSRWDQWPAAARAIPDIGDAIRPSVERILVAHPDLVVLYASGDNRAAATALAAAGIRVVAIRIDRIADFERAVRMLGLLAGLDSAARLAADSVRQSLALVRDRTRDLARPRAFLHAWDNPLMAIGGGSFLSELVEIAGGANIYADRPEPSPQVSFEDLVRRDPDVILAGPTEIDRLRDDARWQALRAVRDGRILAYDTTLVARPSMRLGEAARSLATLLHPDVVFR